MNLWVYNTTTGYWCQVRHCNTLTSETWLHIWQKDEPKRAFRLAKNKPTGEPKPSDYYQEK